MIPIRFDLRLVRLLMITSMVALFFTIPSRLTVSAKSEAYYPEPSLQAVYDTYGRIVLSWSADPGYSYFDIEVVPGPSLNGSGGIVSSIGNTHTYIYRPISQGAYTVAIRGCVKQDQTKDVDQCSQFDRPITVFATPVPAPTLITLPFPHTTSGDCELDSATVTFRSNGSGVFNARVKTNHTRTGDVWHATIAAANSAKQDVVRLSTFDSVVMDDYHGYYTWTQNFEYDPTKYSQIVSINMLARC